MKRRRDGTAIASASTDFTSAPGSLPAMRSADRKSAALSDGRPPRTATRPPSTRPPPPPRPPLAHHALPLCHLPLLAAQGDVVASGGDADVVLGFKRAQVLVVTAEQG